MIEIYVYYYNIMLYIFEKEGHLLHSFDYLLPILVNQTLSGWW